MAADRELRQYGLTIGAGALAEHPRESFGRGSGVPLDAAVGGNDRGIQLLGRALEPRGRSALEAERVYASGSRHTRASGAAGELRGVVL